MLQIYKEKQIGCLSICVKIFVYMMHFSKTAHPTATRFAFLKQNLSIWNILQKEKPHPQPLSEGRGE